jgi:hypothetical protein
MGKLFGWLAKHGRAAALEIGVNLFAPLAIFDLTTHRWGEVNALLASTLPPLVWSIAGFVRTRRLDALSLLVLIGIGLSLAAMAGGGGARFLQLREQLVMAAVGLVFLGSLAVRRPLIYQLARARLRRVEGSEAAWFDSLKSAPAFRRAMAVMTLVWGVALVAEPALCAVLIFRLSIGQFLIVSPVLGYGAFGVLTAWTFWYARRRIGPLRRAAEAEQTQHAPQ